MFRVICVLAWPLIVYLAGSISVIMAITFAALLIYWVQKVITDVAVENIWTVLRPSVFAGLTVLMLFSVLRWVLYLAVLYRRLTERGVSLQEYSGWSMQTRSAWLKDGAQKRQRG